MKKKYKNCERFINTKHILTNYSKGWKGFYFKKLQGFLTRIQKNYQLSKDHIFGDDT